MRPQPETVSVSGYEFTINPLTLGQVRRVYEIMRTPNMDQFERTLKIIMVGLERNHPESVKAIDELVISYDQIELIAAATLRMGGFMRRGDDPTGELKPLPSSGT
jgi:hypothetical protein